MYLVYSQIWLSLLLDDSQFGYITKLKWKVKPLKPDEKQDLEAFMLQPVLNEMVNRAWNGNDRDAQERMTSNKNEIKFMPYFTKEVKGEYFFSDIFCNWTDKVASIYHHMWLSMLKIYSFLCKVEIRTSNDCVLATVQNSHTKCEAIPLKACNKIIICVSEIKANISD
jgi:hypothetical protein